jgi:hypothetical protein
MTTHNTTSATSTVSAAAQQWENLKLNIESGHQYDSFPRHDINLMHRYYGVHPLIKNLSPEHLKKFIEFRFDFLEEEIKEGRDAIAEGNASEIVDSIIDLIVVSLGTLDLLRVDFDTAWQRVLVANMNKTPGIKESRPNELGLPDLIKLPGWVAPNHCDNVGIIPRAFQLDKKETP